MARKIFSVLLILSIASSFHVLGAQLGTKQPSYMPEGPEFSSKDSDETSFANAMGKTENGTTSNESSKPVNLTTVTNGTSSTTPMNLTTATNGTSSTKSIDSSTPKMSTNSTVTTTTQASSTNLSTTPSEMHPTAQPSVAAAPSLGAITLMTLFSSIFLHTIF